MTLSSEYQKLTRAPKPPTKQQEQIHGTVQLGAEHSGALQEYLALGMTYSEIARAINAKFGTHYSRNATISRARRIGLGGPARRPDLTPLPPKDK